MAMPTPGFVVQRACEPREALLPRYSAHSSRALKKKGAHCVFLHSKQPAVIAAAGAPLQQHSDEHSLGHTLAKASLVAAVSFSIAFSGFGTAEARREGVNRPELLPKYFTPVIDAAGFLSEGQEGRIVQEVANLEEETGFKLRVLAQNYPNTPGLAIKDFWKVDDNTIVFVADPSLGGNILNFNVGAAVDLNVPRSFWSRLAGKYGNMFYWQEKGEDASIEAAVSAISTCLREPPGPRSCSNID